MPLEAIIWKKDMVEVLDQTLLPAKTHYIPVSNVNQAWAVINKMQVRGAPAIAIVACLSLVADIKDENYASKISFFREIVGKLNYLTTARPTAVNLKTAADRLIALVTNLEKDETVQLPEMIKRFTDTAIHMLDEDVADNKAIGKYGAQEILRTVSQGSTINVLTHCNTGSLATAGYGTALGVIRSLNESGKIKCVYCTETRPYLQGARLTAYELVHDEIPATLICDDMVAALMKKEQISAVIVGADRVAANGDTANKIGTYQIAILAKYHNVPFYVAAPRTSIDFKMSCGDDIIIEERSEEEMTHINGKRIAAPDIKCWNPAFDVTSAQLITGIITEVGVFRPEDLIKSRAMIKNEKTDS